MKKALILILLIFSFGYQNASAQDVPHIFDSTVPASAEVRTAVDIWLAASPPSSALYYAITYTELITDETTYVSLVGLDSADLNWSLTGKDDGVSHIVWMGTVKVFGDGRVELHTPTQQAMNVRGYKVAAPLSAGGGSSIRFPWQGGKSMMYGPRAVHAAGYSQNGMVAVDLVGGLSMGSGVASASVYAATTGTVDYVCQDDHSVAIRTTNDNYDTFIYAHILDNSSLTMDHEFAAGAMIGTLRSGPFNSSCGWADQGTDQYHLHWGIQPASNLFRAGGCVLSTTSGKWTCGSTTVAPTQYLVNNGAGGTDSGGEANSDPTFFDYVIVGIGNLFDKLIVQNLPTHTASAFVTPIMNSVQVVFRVLTVLVIGNLNLRPAVFLWSIAIAWKLTMGAVWLIGALMRVIKSIPLVP